MPDPDVVTGGTSLLPDSFAVKLCCAKAVVGRMDVIDILIVAKIRVFKITIALNFALKVKL